MGSHYLTLGLALFAFVISTINLKMYFPIWKDLKTAASFLLLSFPTATWIVSAFHVVQWFTEKHIRLGNISDDVLIPWHVISLVIVLIVCCLQLLVLVWRPSWFRKTRKTDTKLGKIKRF